MARVATPDYLRRLDRERLYPYELYDAWVDGRASSRMPFPEDYGGLGGGVVDLAIVAEEIGAVSADSAMAYRRQHLLRRSTSLRKGTEEQKRIWLPKFLSGEVRMSISMSEPDAGSDIGAMRTSARRDGDDWVINGQKIWATGAARRTTSSTST